MLGSAREPGAVAGLAAGVLEAGPPTSCLGDRCQERVNLESWFDETMGRAEGAYKRWAALVLFFVGLAFAVLGNASAVDVARNLWQDPVTREAVAEAATGLVDEEGKPAEPSTPPAIGEVSPSLDADGDGVVSVAEATDRLGELSLPVGWDIDGADDLTVDGKVQTHDNNGLRDFFTDDEATESDTDGDGERIALTALGWLVTALLVMLGGPFWFDLLTRLVALRGSGRKPPTAAEDDTSATSLTVASAISRPAATALPVLGQAERDAELLHLTTMLAAAPATAPPAKRAVKRAP